jgi:thioredoxin 1
MIDSGAEQLSGKVKFLKVNVDQQAALIAKYKIQSMPTVLVLDSKGKVLERKVGTAEIADLLKKLQDSP